MSFRDKFPVFAYKIGKAKCLLSTFPYRKNPIKWSIRTYKKRFGVKLDLTNPRSFYEKMNYWKHFRYDPKQDDLTDKLRVKEILKNEGYEKLCAKVYISSNNIKDIEKWFYENCGVIKKFVFKTSHGNNDVYIYNDGVIIKKGGRIIKNVKSLFKLLKCSLKYNHYYTCFEKNYLNLKPFVFVEEYIDFGNDPVEYELMCNYGEIVFANVVYDRQSNNCKKILVDKNFKFYAKYSGDITEKDILKIQKPNQLFFIQNFIKQHCSEFPFCRVDFIENGDNLYFCEFTFVKSGGIDAYYPLEINDKLGELFRL